MRTQTISLLITLLMLFFGSVLLYGGALQTGDTLPSLSGKTLSDKQVSLPQATAGKPAVVAFGFSRESGVPIRQWAQRLNQEASGVPVYQVPVLEGVPGLFRGLAVGSIRKDTPQGYRDNLVLLYKDEKLWRDKLSVSNDKTAYLVIVDAQGRVVDRVTGDPDEASVTKVKAALQRAQGL